MNADANGLYNHEGNAFTDALIGHNEHQLFHSNKTNVMNEKNFKYLDDQIFYTGFGREHHATLKEKILEGKPEFVIAHQQDFGKDNVAATLHFKKSNEGDLYFLNSYQLLLKNQQHPEPIKQTFYVNNDMRRKEQEDITLKEGYNLLSGRAVNKNMVNKEGTTYNAWVQLDFKVTDKHGNYEEKKYHQNYGFDLEKTLAKHPIKELTDATQKERLLESLQRGNRQSVTLTVEGQEKKVFIEAAPQFKDKGLNFYEAGGQKIRSEKLYETSASQPSVKQEASMVKEQSQQLNGPVATQTGKQGAKKEQQQSSAGDGEEDGAKQGEKKSKRNKQSIS